MTHRPATSSVGWITAFALICCTLGCQGTPWVGQTYPHRGQPIEALGLSGQLGPVTMWAYSFDDQIYKPVGTAWPQPQPTGFFQLPGQSPVYLWAMNFNLANEFWAFSLASGMYRAHLTSGLPVGGEAAYDCAKMHLGSHFMVALASCIPYIDFTNTDTTVYAYP